MSAWLLLFCFLSSWEPVSSQIVALDAGGAVLFGQSGNFSSIRHNEQDNSLTLSSPGDVIVNSQSLSKMLAFVSSLYPVASILKCETNQQKQLATLSGAPLLVGSCTIDVRSGSSSSSSSSQSSAMAAWFAVSSSAPCAISSLWPAFGSQLRFNVTVPLPVAAAASSADACVIQAVVAGSNEPIANSSQLISLANGVPLCFLVCFVLPSRFVRLDDLLFCHACSDSSCLSELHIFEDRIESPHHLRGAAEHCLLCLVDEHHLLEANGADRVVLPLWRRILRHL